MALTHSGSKLAAAFATWLGLGVLCGCATYDASEPRLPSHALPESTATKLGEVFETAASARPGQSGVNYIRSDRVAFGARLAMADVAERTLDLQYYIWDPDLCGRTFGEHVVRAAERGVRVRLLLDDVSIVGRDAAFARLAGHPNLEIRAFNPFRDRRRFGDLFSEPGRINRRTHNKIMIADNALAIVGGRNIADHYFGVHGDSNYRDLDMVAVGPVVRDVSGVFDAFWNSAFAVPYEAFVDAAPTPEDAAAAIAELRALLDTEPFPYPLTDEIVRYTTELERIRDDLIWAPTRVLYDDPAKVEDRSVRGIGPKLGALAASAQQEVLIENAYFVPRDRMVELVAALTARGVKVRVLTNSLASNDVAAVHSGYKKYRNALLEKGAEIYELRPDAAAKARWSILSTKSRSGLHTKAMVVDREHVVIGSYNLDPRSADINSELVLLVDSPEFGRRVGEYLDDGVRPENSYRVTLEDGELVWTTEVDGKPVRYTNEPETSWWQRFVVGLIGLLPIHSQL